MKQTHTAWLVTAAIGVVLSACASDDDSGATPASSLVVDTVVTVAPARTETTVPPETTEPDVDEPPTTTAAPEAPTTTTSGASPTSPAPGEPNTVNIVFEDGETGTAPVTCDSDPADAFFEFSVKSGPDEQPRFELLFFVNGGKVSDWHTEDAVWLVSPSEGSVEVDGDLDQNPITGSGVFLKADLTEEGDIQYTTPTGGQPLTTGEARAAAFTIVCSE